MSVYLIAGIPVEYDCKYELLKSRSKKYIAPAGMKPDFRLELDESYIEAFRKNYPTEGDDDYEYAYIGASFYKNLYRYDGIMLHASAVAVDGYAYLFSAPPGMGKSTHTGLWQKLFGSEKALVINDDKPAIRKINGQYYAFGTPFSGKNDISINSGFLIKGICFLCRGEENRIRALEVSESVAPFLDQTIKPTDMNDIDSMLDVVDDLLKSVKCWFMYCRPDVEAAELAYNAMNGKQSDTV